MIDENNSELCHHGVKGMKWGVRRTPEQLGRTQKKYDPPYSKEEVLKNYGEVTYKRLLADPAHRFRMEKGIELIHREPTKSELNRIWKNWNLMSETDKEISEKKCLELFGMTNSEHYKYLINEYEND